MYLVCQPRSKGYPYGNLYTWLLPHTSVLVLIINSRQYKKYNLQVLQLRQIGKYPRWKLFNFVVEQNPARIRLIILTAYLTSTTISQKNPHHCLFQFLSYLLIAIVLTSVCTGNFTCVHGKLVISLENGKFYALDTILHPPTPIRSNECELWCCYNLLV